VRTRLPFIVVAAFCLTTPAARAQPASALRHRDPQIEELARLAATLPPEFATDILLRLAGSPRVTDLAYKRELIEEAWNRVAFVKEPYRLAAASAPEDSRAFAQTRAYETKLDRVSLQARAVRLMTLVAPAAAREMFEWIDFDLKPPSCEDPLVPVLDDYYETLARLTRVTAGTSLAERGDALVPGALSLEGDAADRDDVGDTGGDLVQTRGRRSALPRADADIARRSSAGADDTEIADC
jgi:hypothetical protein